MCSIISNFLTLHFKHSIIDIESNNVFKKGYRPYIIQSTIFYVVCKVEVRFSTYGKNYCHYFGVEQEELKKNVSNIFYASRVVAYNFKKSIYVLNECAYTLRVALSFDLHLNNIHTSIDNGIN